MDIFIEFLSILWAQLVAKTPSDCTQTTRFYSLIATDSNKQLNKVFFPVNLCFASINGTHLQATYKGCIKKDYTLHTYSDISFSIRKTQHLNMLPIFHTCPSLREN